MNALSGPQVAQILYQVGFRGQELVEMTAIAKRESGYQPGAHRTDSDPARLSGDLGLFQINYVNWDLVSRQLGLTSKSQLFDPVINAQAAKILLDNWKRNGGNHPWGAGPGGWTAGGNPLHGTNVREAQGFVNQAQNSGMLGTPYDGSLSGTSNGGASTNGGAARPGGTTGNEFEPGSGPMKLPPDVEVYVVDGHAYRAVALVDGVYMAWDIAEPDMWDLGDPAKHKQMDVTSFRALDWVPAGSAEELATLAISFPTFGQFWQSVLDQTMGQNNPARNDPGVLRVLAEFAARPDMSMAELQNKLQATEWYQTRTTSELEWNSLSEAERAQRMEEMQSRMADTIFQFTGFRPDISDPTILNYVEEVASGRMGYGAFTEMVKGWADEDEESPWARQKRDAEEARKQRPIDIENTTQRVREAAERWGLDWSDQQMQQWAKKIVENDASDEDLILAMRQEAAVLYPWKDAEVETATAARPWLSTYERTMERTGTINTSQIQKALQAGQTPWEFEQELKSSSEWLGTKNGQQSMTELVSEMGQRMGYN